MEKPCRARIHAPEKLPIALQIGMKHVEKRLPLIARQQRVQRIRAEHQKRHQHVLIVACLCYARQLTHHRARAIAAHDILPAQVQHCAVLTRERPDACARIVLRKFFRRISVKNLDCRQLRRATTQRRFRCILRQTLVVPEIKRAHERALIPVIIIIAEKRTVSGGAADAKLQRDGRRRPDVLLDAPEPEVLHGALRQVLAFWNRLGLRMTLCHNAGNASLREVDSKAHAHRPAADNNDLRLLIVHFGLSLSAGKRLRLPVYVREPSSPRSFCQSRVKAARYVKILSSQAQI